MLCPISRALDRVGDRWTLLIVRDLHSGPMRFGEILKGLPGLASNLLSTRLDKLQADSLVERDGNAYVLTELGRQTEGVLWELAKLGMGFAADPEVKAPGHLRLVAVTLQMALRQVASPDLEIVAELVLDGEPFIIAANEEGLTVRAGSPQSPATVAHTSYETMMLAAGGGMPFEEFRREHLTIDGPSDAVAGFEALMERVMIDVMGTA